MRLLLVIDHLGLGGAQRQVVELACGLKQLGHDVEMLIYFPQYDFFRTRIVAQGIVIHDCLKKGRVSIGVVRKLCRLMIKGNFDLVVSYLNSPNVYAELARLISRRPKLVVSERCSHHDDSFSSHAQLRRWLHICCDHVVTNSQAHAQWLQCKWWLAGKASCIYNGVDLAALTRSPLIPADSLNLRLLAVGRVSPQKNILRLITALQLFYEHHGFVPQVSWAGKRDASAVGRRYAAQIDDLLERLPEVRNRWHWLGEQPDMPQLMRQHHALIHPSLYEGLPNAVCEALAAGMPVLISSVCDHPLLVADNERGFIFDPSEPSSIAGAIGKLTRLDAQSWERFSRNARQYAEAYLSIGTMVRAYENLFVGLVDAKNQ